MEQIWPYVKVKDFFRSATVFFSFLFLLGEIHIFVCQAENFLSATI